ncbi:MAG: ATP-binding protein [Acidimicrobiales bacterium]
MTVILSDVRSFSPEPGSVSDARRWLRDVTQPCLSEDEVDDLVLAGSELVTNALLHGQGDIEVKVVCEDSTFHLEVVDGAPWDSERVQPSSGSVLTGGGRGLTIVATLASSWGVTSRESVGGKLVWVTFDRPKRGTITE